MRGDRVFLPVIGSSPAFNTTSVGSTAHSYALESTVRLWQGPHHRSVRIGNSDSAATFFVKLGNQSVSASTNDTLVLDRYPNVFYISANVSHISFISSTNTIINVTLGYGGETKLRGPRFVATSTVIPSTVTIFTIQQAGSITHVNWLDDLASWTIGDAAHILGMYHYSTST